MNINLNLGMNIDQKPGMNINLRPRDKYLYIKIFIKKEK